MKVGLGKAFVGDGADIIAPCGLQNDALFAPRDEYGGSYKRLPFVGKEKLHLCADHARDKLVGLQDLGRCAAYSKFVRNITSFFIIPFQP